MAKPKTPEELRATLSVYRGILWLRKNGCHQSLLDIHSSSVRDPSYLAAQIEAMERELRTEAPQV